jgi:hypothetical protein
MERPTDHARGLIPFGELVTSCEGEAIGSNFLDSSVAAAPCFCSAQPACSNVSQAATGPTPPPT